MNRAFWSSVAAAALVLTGCSNGGDAEDPVPTQSPTTTVTTAPATQEPQPTEAPPEATGQTYRIRRGDTLSAIAQRFDTTVRALSRLNDIDDPNEIRAGQRIEIPGGADQ